MDNDLPKPTPSEKGHNKPTAKDISEAVRLHRLWLDGNSEGNRLSLRGADLRNANLRNANFRNADLRDADLRGADLEGATGNMAEVRSMQLDTWPIVWVRAPDGAVTLQIGCERHSLGFWENARDEVIKRMDDEALDWWKANKDFVLATVKRFPAVSHGEAKE